MDRILFRGFAVDNEYGRTTVTVNGKQYRGDWHEGDFIQSRMSSDESRKYWIVGAGHRGGALLVYQRYQIIPETLGQFTGLRDKFCHYIYEGDILKDEDGNIIECMFEIDDAGSRFRFEDKKRPRCMYFRIEKRFEIIGNIHENADLLKG